jgi:hypothetical protein
MAERTVVKEIPGVPLSMQMALKLGLYPGYVGRNSVSLPPS